MNTQRVEFPSEPVSPVRMLDSGSASSLLRVVLQSDAAGVVDAPAVSRPTVVIHVGRPVQHYCRHGDERRSGLAIHGDIDIIPSGLPARWEMKATDTALILRVSSRHIQRVAEESGSDPRLLRLRDRFQIRDPQIEHIGWALMAEMEQGCPSGGLFMESMATALAVKLLRSHSSFSSRHAVPNGGLSVRKLRQVTSYIEENLSEELSLAVIARVAELSASHLKVLFRKSVGMPVHQYVIRRRVERAALLLRHGRMPISQIALETGFAHQSHLAMHMRRVLGVSPRLLSQLSESAHAGQQRF